MVADDDYEDVTEDEFDAALAAAEPAELVFDQRLRVTGGGLSAVADVSRTWAPGKPTRLTGPIHQHTVVSSVVLTSANG